MPTLEFAFEVDDVLTDPTDSTVLLSDPDGTFGVKRNDTSAVVVADATAMTRISAGIYRHTFSAPASGLSYTWYAEVAYDGATYHFEREFTDGGDAEWYYGDQDAVEELIGAEALRAASNEPGASSATVIDTARVLSAGLDVDAEIDARMAALGYVTPMTVDETVVGDLDATHATRRLLRGISARLVAWKLNEPRMLMAMVNAPNVRTLNALDQTTAKRKHEAEMMLQRIAMRVIHVTADRLYDRTSPAEVYLPTSAESVPVIP